MQYSHFLHPGMKAGKTNLVNLVRSSQQDGIPALCSFSCFFFSINFQISAIPWIFLKHSFLSQLARFLCLQPRNSHNDALLPVGQPVCHICLHATHCLVLLSPATRSTAHYSPGLSQPGLLLSKQATDFLSF